MRLADLRTFKRILLRLGASSLLLAVYALLLLTVRRINIHSSDIEVAGLRLVVHHAARALFCGYLLLIGSTAGVIILRYALRLSDPRELGYRSYLVCSWFAGATSLSLIAVLLGFFRSLSLNACLGLSVSLVAAAPFVLADLGRETLRRLREILRHRSLTMRVVWPALAVFTLLAAAHTMVVKVIFPESVDGDVWEHYFHYYHQVAQSGSILPNDVWYHFYLSKGAGLFFFSVLLTDAFGAALVSWCYLLITTLMLYDLVARCTRDRIWAMVAAALTWLFYGFVSGDVSSLHKHHTLIMAYLCLACWAGIRISEPRLLPRAATSILVVTLAGCVYLGFYVPAAAVLICTGLAGLFCIQFVIGAPRRRLRSILLWGAAAMTGLAVAMLVNFAITGMFEVAPSRFFWELADQQRFERIWDRYTIEYFFVEAEDIGRRRVGLSSLLQINVEWICQLCRWTYFKRFFREAAPIMAIIALSAYALRGRPLLSTIWGSRRQYWRHAKYLLAIGCYLGGLLLVAQALPFSASLQRMYTFTGVFLILSAVVVWSAAAGRLKPSSSLVGALIAALALIQPTKSILRTERPEYCEYALGKISSIDAMSVGDDRFDRAARTADLWKMRQEMPPGEKLLFLTYDPGPGYFLPGTPLLSEPTYSFGDDYDVILFGPPDEAQQALRQQGINYFGLTLDSPLFVGIPFSPLFAAEELEQRFGLVWREGETFLLTWKDEDTLPLPPGLVQAIEWKQTDKLRYLVSPNFRTELEKRVRREYWFMGPRATKLAPDEAVAVAERARDCAAAVLAEKVRASVKIPDNRAFTDDLIDEVYAAGQRDPPYLKSLWRFRSFLKWGAPAAAGHDLDYAIGVSCDMAVSDVRRRLERRCKQTWNHQVQMALMKASAQHLGWLHEQMERRYLVQNHNELYISSRRQSPVGSEPFRLQR